MRSVSPNLSFRSLFFKESEENNTPFIVKSSLFDNTSSFSFPFYIRYAFLLYDVSTTKYVSQNRSIDVKKTIFLIIVTVIHGNSPIFDKIPQNCCQNKIRQFLLYSC